MLSFYVSLHTLEQAARHSRDPMYKVERHVRLRDIGLSHQPPEVHRTLGACVSEQLRVLDDKTVRKRRADRTRGSVREGDRAG